MSNSDTTITVLVSARRNSKYLAKFMHGFFTRTAQMKNIELFVMLNKHDTWNRELQAFYMAMSAMQHNQIRFFEEDLGQGRAGLHNYFNHMAEYATGEWIIYFCEDHFIEVNGWDDEIRKFAADKNLDPSKIYCIVPKFDNVGTMNHIISKGMYFAMGQVGRHGWIDSYLNEVIKGLPTERVLKMDRELFHDFTHDQPNPMSEAHLQSVSPADLDPKEFPAFDQPSVARLVQEDRDQLFNQVRKGM